MDNTSRRNMGYIKNTVYLLLIIVLSIKDVGSFTVSLIPSGTAYGLKGKNQVELVCEYSLASGDTIYSLEWHRKKPSPSNDYETIAKFYPPSDNQQDANVVTATTEGAAVNGRVNLTNPTSTSLTAKVLFTDIVCNDEREYQCKVTGDTNTGIESKTATKNLVVRAEPLPPTALVVEPNSSVEEDGSLKFTCSGNVGRPEGKYKWSKFIGSSESPISPAQTTSTKEQDGCTYKGVSTITLKMSKDDNQAVIRCTVDSHVTLPTSETNKLYKMTDKINVYYQARTPSVTKTPNQEVYYAGESTVTLSCSSEGNPSPSYKWLAPNGTEVSRSENLVFNSMSLDQSGTYTCVSENSYNSKTFNATNSVEIKIDPPTTQAPTTVPPSTPTATSTSGPGDKGGQTGEDDSGGLSNTIIAVIVVVIVVVVVVVVIIVVCVCRKKKARKEVDEPPEKPRNNQTLNFGNTRPDVVGDYKNKNSPFNNQFDKGNSNQLAYADLSFDSNGSSALNLTNKPRSRQPIQLYESDLDRDLDGPPTTYSEVNVMPAHLPRV